jgi:hypothetical protein
VHRLPAVGTHPSPSRTSLFMASPAAPSRFIARPMLLSTLPGTTPQKKSLDDAAEAL